MTAKAGAVREGLDQAATIEIMTDRKRRLTPGRRTEYASIVRDELSALDRDVRLYFEPPSPAPN